MPDSADTAPTPTAASTSLAGRTIAVTADRRHDEQVDRFRARGATVVSAPTMRTLDLSTDEDLRAMTAALIAEPVDHFIATTGFGMRLWFDSAEAWGLLDGLLESLRRSRLVARGPKAQSALRQRSLDVAWRAPGESMTEVVDHVAGLDGVAGSRVAVQLFDPDDHPSSSALADAVGELVPVPMYRWLHPVDTTPVDALVEAIIAGDVDAVTFTSQPAVRFLLELAGDRAEDVVDACNDGRCQPICIGPVCAEPGVEAGITTMRWPDPYRLVPMVKLVEDVLAR